MCCHESPWSHTEESPVAVGFAVAEELGWAALSITQPLRCLLWLGDNGPLLGRETRNLNLTQEALKATQNKLLSSGISPYRKTISAVIKGELNRLISSKVTEQPSLSTPPPLPLLLFSFHPLSHHPSQSPREVEAINEMPSDLWGVRGHRTKNVLLNALVWKERLCVLFGSDRWTEGGSREALGNMRHCVQANHFV